MAVSVSLDEQPSPIKVDSFEKKKKKNELIM